MFPRITLAFVALAALAQEQPTFRAGTRLVEMNVIVRNNKGPVAGLTKGDFTILDRGKSRTISFFSATSSSSGTRPGTTPAVPLPPGTVSNRLNGRGEIQPTATILLIDRLNTEPLDQARANDHIIDFLRRHGNGGRLAIYVLGQQLKVLQELTDDPQRVELAVKNLKPGDARGVMADPLTAISGGAATIGGTETNKSEMQADFERAESSRMMGNALEHREEFVVKNRIDPTRAALVAIAKHLSQVPGRKNLVWISGGLPFTLTSRMFGPTAFDTGVDGAVRVLSDANVAMYSVDARGLGIPGSGPSTAKPAINLPTTGLAMRLTTLPAVLQSVTLFAALTGGVSYYNYTGLEDSLGQAAEDAELSYRIGFDVPEEEFNGQFRNLEVKVNQKGVEVRSRNGYFASKVPLPPTGHRSLPEFMSDPLDAMAVGLTAQATLDPADPDTYNIHARVALQDIHLGLQAGRWVGAVKLSLFSDGASSARTITRKVDIAEAQLAAALEQGIEIDGAVKAPSGAEAIRVVAQDSSTGAAGSVRLPLGRGANRQAK